MKRRNLLVSLAYRLSRFVPHDVMLDLAAITDRLARDNAGSAGFSVWGENDFIHRHIRPDDRVLEIGCSAGRVLSTIRARERVGVDRDEAAIRRGRREHPELTLIAGEAENYLRGTAFDVLILSHVLEHLDRPEDLLATLPGKFARVYVEVPDFDWNPLNQVRLKRGRDLLYMDDDHLAEFDRDELEAMFHAAGLTVLDREFRWGFMRYWLYGSHAPSSRERLAAGPPKPS